LRRGRRKQNGKNIPAEELKRAEREEEIVHIKFLKGGCDVFFYCKHSTEALARRGFVAESLEAAGAGARVAQLWDGDPEWMRDE
jgi:hypothetical protein